MIFLFYYYLSIINRERFVVDVNDFKVHIVDVFEVFFVHDLIDCSEFCNLSVNESANVIGVERRIVDFVKNQYNGLSKLVAKSADDSHQIGCVINIKVVCRLIEQNVVRVLRDNHCDVRSLPLTTR